MAVETRSNNPSLTSDRVVAFFKDKSDAYRAISQLKNSGFTSDEIGLIVESDSGSASSGSPGTSTVEHESLWDKIKNMFSEDSSGSSDYTADYQSSVSGMNWDRNRTQYYYRGLNEGGALVTVNSSRFEQARQILQQAGGDLRESGFESSRGQSGTERTGEDYRIQLRGEVLRTYRERVPQGEVRLRKDVITKNQTVEVPVTREEIVVERVPASGQQTSSGEIGSDKEIRVPLSEERVRVEKQPVVNEEVRVGKRTVQNTERVSEDVRNEELRVDDERKFASGQPRKDKKPAA